MPSASPRFGIVASRFNHEITERLVRAALDFLLEKRVVGRRVDLVWVPGAFELPVAASRLARSKRKRYRAIVALGCIVKGQTPNDQHLAQAVFQGLMTVSVATGVPVACGVITAPSWKLASDRAGNKRINRGREAAQAAWEMARQFQAL